MSDPTAAERARRYRARRRDGSPAELGLADQLERLAVAVDNLAAKVDNLAERDVTQASRDVTFASRSLNGAGARAGAVDDAPSPPSGARGASPVTRDAVTALSVAVVHGRILEALTRAPATVAALADAIDQGQRATLEALVELAGMHLVRRVAGATPADRDRWERIASPLVEALELGLDSAEVYQ